MDQLKGILAEQQQQPSNQEKLKIFPTQSFELAKDIFWKYARRRAQKELKLEYHIDDENRAAVAGFVAYFTGNNEVMEQYGIDSRKGILILGNPGSGKSMLFRILRDCRESRLKVQLGEREVEERLFFHRSGFVTCEHMAKLFMDKGEAGLAPFGKNAVVEMNGDVHCRHTCFDDLGAEEVRNLYGNKKEVMVDIINERYDHFVNSGLKTHFTTNLHPDEIEKRYSTRVRSRLKHMCNILMLGASEEYKDRR